MLRMADRAGRGALSKARAGWVGPEDPQLYGLLSDVLGEAGIELNVRPPEHPDVVLAAVHGSSIDAVSAVLSSARQLAQQAPVIALLPIGDDRLAQRCIQLGAQGCWALDTPLSLLRSLLGTMVALPSASSAPRGRLGRSSEHNFRLGPQARALLGVLREQHAPGSYPQPTVGQDAEERIERAVRKDLAWQRMNAREVPESFTFGVHARLEVTLMRLDAHATSLIERAVQADLDVEALRGEREFT